MFSTSAQARAKEVFSFAGNLNIGKKEAFLALNSSGSGKAEFNLKFTRGNIVRFTAQLDHLKTPWFDISSNIYGGWKFIRGFRGGEPLAQGKVNSYYTLVNYKPVRDLEFVFQAAKKQLILQKMVIGPLSGKAAMTLAEPHIIDGKLQLTECSLASFLSLWIPARRYDSGGELNASIRFQGTPDKMHLRAHAESEEGYIKHFNFSQMALDFEGVYPRLYISDANITDKRGMRFSVIGPLDLSEIKHIKQQIESLTFSPLVVDSERKSEWTIHRFEGENEKGATFFKAFLNKSNIGFGSSGMIGVERKIEF